MKKHILILGLALVVATGGKAQAASHEHEMSQHQMATQPAATHAGIGVLKALNAKAGKIQILHEPIASLDWPAMTMWFRLQAPLPENIKIGDTVRFEMIEDKNKQWEIVRIDRK